MFTQYFVMPCFPIYQYPALVWAWVKAFVCQDSEDCIAEINAGNAAI